jgi:hypothetical protein
MLWRREKSLAPTRSQTIVQHTGGNEKCMYNFSQKISRERTLWNMKDDIKMNPQETGNHLPEDKVQL